MKKEIKMHDNQLTVSYEETTEKKDAVFQKIIEYCKKHECSAGEILQQDDDCIIDAPNVLSEIIDDILNFTEKWDE